MGYEIISKNFESGSVTFMELNSSGEVLEQRRVSYQENLLKQKLSWYELMFIGDLEHDIEILDRVEVDFQELPTPPELYDWIKGNNPTILAASSKQREIEATINRLAKANIGLNIRPFYNSPGNQYVTSVNYDLFGKELTPTVNFSNLTETPSPSATWSAGVTFNVSVGSNSSDGDSIASLELQLYKSEIELDYLVNSINLKLRSSYQQYAKNKELLIQAERSFENTRNSNNIIKTKAEIGQLSNYELLESDAQVERSLWKLEVARINIEKSWLDVIDSATWYNQIDIQYKK